MAKHLKLLHWFQHPDKYTELKQKPSRGRWALITFDNRLSTSYNNACYADLPFDNAKQLLVFQDGVLPYLEGQGIDSEMVINWYQWLIKDSPFSSYYLSDNAKSCIKNGFPINCNLPEKQMLFAATLLNVWEHRHSCYATMRLIEQGCEPLMATLMSYRLYPEDISPSASVTVGVPTDNGHTPFISSVMSKEVIRNILEGNVVSTESANGLFGKGTFSNYDALSLIEQESEGKVREYIFPQMNVVPVEKTYTYEQLAQGLNKYYASIMQEMEKKAA